MQIEIFYLMALHIRYPFSPRVSCLVFGADTDDYSFDELTYASVSVTQSNPVLSEGS